MEESDDFKKYFNSEKYFTKILGNDTEENQLDVGESKISNLISLLTDPINKSFKELTLLTLKKEKSEGILLLSIASPKAKNIRHMLIAACWESEINFTRYFPFFILLAIDTDYMVSLEAITVISSMEGPFNKVEVQEAIKKVKIARDNSTSERIVLLNDLLDTLSQLETEK